MIHRQQIRQLEHAALARHQAGQSWREFHAANLATIIGLIQANPAGWPEVADKLLALLVSGDTGGLLPAGVDLVDEAPAVVLTPDDTETQARCLWPRMVHERPELPAVPSGNCLPWQRGAAARAAMGTR
jgi:hypothetical protein